MLKMVGHRLLIKPKKVEVQLDENLKGHQRLQESGFKIAADSQSHRVIEGATEIGTVIDIGKMAWRAPDLGFGLPGWREWCNIGDEVVYARYAGKPIKDPDLLGEEAKFVVINDVDVQAVSKYASA